MNRPVVLLTQPITDSAMTRISQVANVRVASDRSEETLRREIRDAAVLVVRDPIPASVIAAGSMLRLVARHGVGTDYIPVEECSRRGIPVTITPGANTNAVVEWVIGAMISLAHRFGAATEYTRRGEWKRRDGLEGLELAGKTLGIIGFGRIGSALAVLASSAFRMEVLAFDPARDAQAIAAHSAKKVSLEDLLKKSNFISLHLPATHETNRSINGIRLAQVKRGAFLINGARGSLVDTDALVGALKSGQLAGAALDGVEGEPLALDHPLLHHNNVIVTPHSAALTEEALYNMGHMVADEIERILGGHAPLNQL